MLRVSLHNRNTITNNFGGPVNFLSDEGADGFTISDSNNILGKDLTDLFTTQFKGINNQIFTKPNGLIFDTHDVQTGFGNSITFGRQVSEGVNFIDILDQLIQDFKESSLP